MKFWGGEINFRENLNHDDISPQKLCNNDGNDYKDDKKDENLAWKCEIYNNNNSQDDKNNVKTTFKITIFLTFTPLTKIQRK